MIKIGNVPINTNILLAPLAGCSDLPFRMIAREHGAKFCFYEMVDSNSLIHDRHETYGNLKTDETDSPIAVQLLGSDPAGMLEAAERLLGLVKASFLDINCACPAKKVIKKRAGAHLLRDTPRMYNILKKLVPALPLPVTIKIRTGFDKKDDDHIVDMVKRCEDIGVSAVFAHGRLKTQGYAGVVDYDAIKKIKDAVRIPVFGSGNIFSGESAKAMLDETGCNGILVARGALGNPWIFKEIEEYIKTGKSPKEIPLEEKKKTLKKHLDYIDKYKSMSLSGKIGFMRKVAIWYLKNIPGASNLRARITRETKSYQDLLKIITCMLIAFIALMLVSSPAAAADYDKFLERIERQAFDYFLNETDKATGLTLNTTEPEAPATNAASGFTLSAMVIGAERGWIAKESAYKMCLKILNTFKKMENFEGFTYHYFDVDNGSRMWASEVSCIDTALFSAGAITAGEYFKGTEVSALTGEIFKKVNWEWFLNNERALQMSWKPEKGFSGRIDSFSEGIICYILAMGSPTHPIPKECWDSFTRPVSQYGGYKLIYVADGSLFQYLFPLAWLDLRDKHDKYADYWQNAIKAAKTNKKYCLDNSDAFATYREGFWGLSASLSPDGYRNFGARPGRNKHNGTAAPYAVAGSIPLVPKFAIANYESMYDRVSAAVKKYGLTDAFNIDRKWASEYYISIDQGLTLLMIENYRTGLIWKYFMQNDYVKKGLEAAGFVPGKQDEPSWLAASMGNPDDKIEVKKLNKKIIVDGNLSDWANSGGAEITLTAKNNRNIEMAIGTVRDDSDLSAVFYLGRDDKNLYIAGRIYDDSLVTNEKRDMIYKDDCVEIFFDTNGDGYYFDRNPNDYQLGIAPYGPDKIPQAWAWGYLQKAPDNISYAAKLTKDGYIVEIQIPFDAINNFGPNKNKSTRFTISVHDRDADGKTKKLTWSIDSASQPGKILFGTLRLTD